MAVTEIQSQVEYLKYSKEEVHGYSPAIGRLIDLSVSYIHDAEKAYEEGKNSIWVGGGGWVIPLVYACDTIPVSFSDMGRLSDQESIEIAEDYYQFPQETCSMVKSTVGQWHLRREGSGIKRILGASVACEPYNMAWEVMKKQGYDIHTIDVIYRALGVDGERFEQLVEFFVEQIYGVVEWLTGSRVLNEEKLRLEIKRNNRLISKVLKILELRRQHPFYMRSLPTLYLLSGLSSHFAKPEEFEEVVDQLIEELENAAETESNVKVIPLVWVGGLGQEFGAFEAIDQAGGALLGFRGAPFNYYREDVPPVESLARFVLGNQQAGASIYVQDVIEQEINKINARGLVLYGFLGCSYSSVAREMWRDHFHKKGIPSINLEGTFQVGAPSGQTLTRVKAFIEMLS